MFSKILPRVHPRARNPLWLALNNETYALQLKPYKRIHFHFDPFHPKVASIREFLIKLDTKKVRKTNPKCTIRTEISSEQLDPVVTAYLDNGKKILFKTANLTTLELLQYFNQYTNKFTEEQE